MATLTRHFDWSQTSLGLPESWPQSLRTVVGIILSSKFPMFLWWGENLIQFYNDAYRPSLGNDGKHPSALGNTGEETWPEIWHIIKPLIDQVKAGGEATWSEDQLIPIYRNGSLENVYWTFSYSPVRDDIGMVAGVLVTCSETTDKVLNIRYLKDSKAELEFAIEATELGIWDLNPLTGRFTANTRLKDWFGLRPDEEIPLSFAIDSIASKDRQRVSDAINTALQVESGGYYDIEYTILPPGMKEERIVKARGRAWFGADKKAYRFNGTLQDLTLERKAQDEKIAAQTLANVAVKGSGIGVFNITTADGKIEYTPEFAAILTGNSQKTNITRNDFVRRIHPDDESIRAAASKAVQETGEFNYEARVIWDDRSVHCIRIIGVSLQNAIGETILFSGTVQDITEQRNARTKVEESEARFRALIEEAPIATCLFVGREMRIEVANDRMIGFWGKGTAVLGKPLADAVPELKGQPFLQILDEVFSGGNTYEAKGARADLEVDGKMSTYYFDFTYKPLRDETGEIYGIMDMAVDVTEQVLAGQKLIQSEEFSRTIFYNSPVAKLVFVGGDMVLREANEKMLEIFGRDISIVGKSILETIPELLPTPMYEQYMKVLSTGEIHQETAALILIIKDGKPYWGYYDYTYKPLRNNDGIIYGVICTAIDVTEAVEDRRRLEEAESNLLGAIELADLGTWSIDASTMTLLFSDRLAKWFGCNKEENLQNVLSHIVEEDRSRVFDAIHATLQPNSLDNYDEIYTVIHAVTGQKRILHAQGKAVLDGFRKPIKINGTAQDITLQRVHQLALEGEVQERTEELAASNEELQSTVEELAESNQALVTSNEELAQYAYVASHDLQEPLRKIQIFAGMLENSDTVPTELRLPIEKILQSARRMSHLIRDLLEFSRLLQSDTLVRPVDLNQIVNDVVNDFELTIQEKKATVIVGDLPVINGVSLQLNQLFHNLISNALKFGKEEEPICLDIQAALIEGKALEEFVTRPSTQFQYYHVTVTDNGIGFENKYADQIFEVFKRLHGREIYPGSGIGLALCRRIVANHEGVLFADSFPGKGSTFHIILPDKRQKKS